LVYWRGKRTGASSGGGMFSKPEKPSPMPKKKGKLPAMPRWPGEKREKRLSKNHQKKKGVIVGAR